jgi:integrase
MKRTKETYRSGEHALTGKQVDLFLSVVTDVRDLALFQVALTGGLRRDDIVNLMRSGVNFVDGSLHFYEKKKKRFKTIFLPSSTMNTLQMVFRAYPREKGRLFPISSKTAYNRFQTYLDRAGISRRPFHSLRATCIKLCQSRGWQPEQTAEHVGDRVPTIQEHYLTPSVDEMRDVTREKAIL